jgi:2-polyprenyl-6-methoxyphenol hydroxylase-like FAD-dependent oxidoreductase
VWKRRLAPNDGFSVWCGSRFAYEHTLRRVLMQDTPNVRLVQQAKQVEPVFSQASPSERARVTGVRFTERGQAEKIVPCDLMVDASGRRSNIVKWLTSMHVGGAADTTWVDAGVCYTSFICARPPGASLPFPAPDGRTDLPWNALMVYQDHSVGNQRHFLMYPIERDRFNVSLGGVGGEKCPTRWEDAIEFAKGLSHDCAYHLMQKLTPVESATSTSGFDGYLYVVPPATKRALERMTNFPLATVVTGDAACCFNPVFAQGMSMACVYAIALQREMKSRLQKATAHKSAESFRAAMQKAVDSARSKFWWTTFEAWSITCVEDTRWSFTITNVHWFWRGLSRLLQPVVAAFHWSSSQSAQSFLWSMETAQMVRPLIFLYHPNVTATVAYHALCRAIGVRPWTTGTVTPAAYQVVGAHPARTKQKAI